MTISPFRILVPLISAALLTWGFFSLNGAGVESRPLALSLVLGTAFGIVLQRSRFCFLCNFRDLVEHRQAEGVIAIIIALAVGAIGYTTIFGAWLPTPALERLPPTAHIGPVSVTLAIAATVFGIGMAISGSCLSAHFYRLSEGSVISPFAIIGALIGFGLGFLTWNSLFLAMTSNAFIGWLPHHLGYAGSLIATLVVLAALALAALWWAKPQAVEPTPSLTLESGLRKLFFTRWPAALTGTLIGLISTLAYLRVAPLGVTAELGSIARTAGSAAGIVPSTLFGLDTLRGCATVIKETLLSNNGLFVLGIIGGSFITSFIAGQFKPRALRRSDVARGLIGGLLLGWGAMTALGCTVGVLLSGIQAGSVSGWIFLVFMSLGILASWKVSKAIGLSL